MRGVDAGGAVGVDVGAIVVSGVGEGTCVGDAVTIGSTREPHAIENSSKRHPAKRAMT